MAGPELTVDVSANPRVEVFFDAGELDGDTARLRMYRFSENRTWLVRGGVDVVPGSAALDFEVPFNTVATYRAEMFDGAGQSLGFTDTSSTEVEYEGTVVHQPLAPSLWAHMTVLDGSGASLVRPTAGELVGVEGAVPARWIGTRRRGLVDTLVSLGASTVEDADRFQFMLSSYTTQQLGILCIRTSDGIRWPRTFFARGEFAEIDWDVRLGGEYIVFEAASTEVEPPFPGITTPLLSYSDMSEAFSTYTALAAAIPTYTQSARSYEYAGLAG